MKVFTGKVVSKKMAKTASVEVERIIAHPIYKKRYKISKKYHVHDTFDVKVGDRVRFVATKPISKIKKWTITEVVGNKKHVAKRKGGKK